MSRAFFNDILTLGVLAIGGYLIYTKTDWFQQGLETIKELVGEIKGGGSGGGPLIDLGGGAGAGAGRGPTSGGGPISQTGSCPGGTSCGPCRSQSGGIRCECDNYNGDSYEATFCGTWSGDDLSIKMWGPKHSGSNCCWCILNTSPDGKMRMRVEGPHPDTGDVSGVTGSVGGKPTCVKAVIYPGPKGAHVEGYGLVGGKWVKGLTYDGPCGKSKTSTKVSANQQVSFRCDGSMNATCATVKPLANANYASAGQYSTSLFTNNRPYYSQSKISNMV
jgi:hypothetical protein